MKELSMDLHVYKGPNLYAPNKVLIGIYDKYSFGEDLSVTETEYKS